MAEMFNMPNQLGISGKHILRKTGEEVEVITFNQVENGARNEDDWVTYIDSEGNEHIKEHLNMQLDFKASDAFSQAFSSLLSFPKYEAPSTENSRLYETAKGLLIEKDCSVDRAIALAKRLVDGIREGKDEQ